MLSLVAGGAGFIGSHLVDMLLTKGHDVIIADDLTSGSLGNLGHALISGRATFIFADVRQPFEWLRAKINEAVRGKTIDRIYDLASRFSSPRDSSSPWNLRSSDRLPATSLIDLALENRARLIYAASADFDISRRLVEPLEADVLLAAVRRGLDARTVRFFDCYGPRMSSIDGHFLLSLAEAVCAGRALPLYGDGRQTRFMTFVSDALRLLELVATCSHALVDPVNIGSEEERSQLDIVETFARVAQIPLRLHVVKDDYHNHRHLRCDLTVAKELGYVPEISLEKGIGETLDWYRDRALNYA